MGVSARCSATSDARLVEYLYGKSGVRRTTDESCCNPFGSSGCSAGWRSGSPSTSDLIVDPPGDAPVSRWLSAFCGGGREFALLGSVRSRFVSPNEAADPALCGNPFELFGCGFGGEHHATDAAQWPGADGDWGMAVILDCFQVLLAGRFCGRKSSPPGSGGQRACGIFFSICGGDLVEPGKGAAAAFAADCRS